MHCVMTFQPTMDHIYESGPTKLTVLASFLLPCRLSWNSCTFHVHFHQLAASFLLSWPCKAFWGTTELSLQLVWTTTDAPGSHVYIQKQTSSQPVHPFKNYSTVVCCSQSYCRSSSNIIEDQWLPPSRLQKQPHM